MMIPNAVTANLKMTWNRVNKTDEIRDIDKPLKDDEKGITTWGVDINPVRWCGVAERDGDSASLGSEMYGLSDSRGIR